MKTCVLNWNWMPEAFSLMISDFGPHFTHVIAVTVRHFLRKSLKYAQVQQTITFKTQKKKISPLCQPPATSPWGRCRAPTVRCLCFHFGWRVSDTGPGMRCPSELSALSHYTLYTLNNVTSSGGIAGLIFFLKKVLHKSPLLNKMK